MGTKCDSGQGARRKCTQDYNCGFNQYCDTTKYCQDYIKPNKACGGKQLSASPLARCLPGYYCNSAHPGLTGKCVKAACVVKSRTGRIMSYNIGEKFFYQAGNHGHGCDAYCHHFGSHMIPICTSTYHYPPSVHTVPMSELIKFM